MQEFPKKGPHGFPDSQTLTFPGPCHIYHRNLVIGKPDADVFALLRIAKLTGSQQQNRPA
jgi:hypothetical protein